MAIKQLVIPSVGKWDLYPFLHSFKVQAINVLSFIMIENAKKGTKELIPSKNGHVDTPNKMFAPLKVDKTAMVLRIPVETKQFSREGNFVLSDEDFTFHKAINLNNSKEKTVTVTCYYDPESHIFNLMKYNKNFIGLVVEFVGEEISDVTSNTSVRMPLYFMDMDTIHNINLVKLLNSKLEKTPEYEFDGDLAGININSIYIDSVILNTAVSDTYVTDGTNRIVKLSNKDWRANSIIKLKSKIPINQGCSSTADIIEYHQKINAKDPDKDFNLVLKKSSFVLCTDLKIDPYLKLTIILRQTNDPNIIGVILGCDFDRHMCLGVKNSSISSQDKLPMKKEIKQYLYPKEQLEVLTNLLYDSTSRNKLLSTVVDLPPTNNQAGGNNKSSKNLKEDKDMSKELFGKVYGPVPDGVVAMDITGKIVMKPFNARSFKRYDTKKGKMVDMLDHVIKLNGHLAYILPVSITTIKAGDIVVIADKEFYVVKTIGKDGIIKGINLNDSTMLEIVPESLVGSDISFVPKVINLLNPDELDPMLMMMVLDDEEDAIMDSKTAMLMMMGMNNKSAEEDNNNNMNMMLPMLLMSKSDSNSKDLLLPMMMMNQGNNANMNTMLPLLMLGDDDNDDNNFKDLALIMMMNGNLNNESNGLDSNMLLPMMLMDKSSGKKDMLLMMTMLQKQANLERTLQLIDKKDKKDVKTKTE